MYKSTSVVLSLVVILCITSIAVAARVSPFFKNNLKYDPIPSHIKATYDSESNAGEALIMSEYLDSPVEGRRKACVDIGHPFGPCEMLDQESPLNDVTPFSYSGFFNVNETFDSNLFYWFFEAQNGNKQAPIMIWLQGGPGGSSLFGLFVENGPFSILPNLTMVPKNITWNAEYSMLYIDNPVGTGFSYTNTGGYSTNQDEIAANLYSLLNQFYKIFPQFVGNDLYIAGESYAGKYVPATAYYILQQNLAGAQPQINLVGISVGDGLCDPVTQVTQYANLAFYTGLADINQQQVMTNYQDKIVESILNEQWIEANNLFTELINGPPDYFQNITGEPDYYDIRRTVEPTYGGDYSAFVNSTKIRALLHVGNHYYQNNNEVGDALAADIPKSIKPVFPALLDNIKVLLYNGQFDFIVGVSLTETFIRTIDWEGIYPFLQQDRTIWYIPSDTIDVAGYVRHYKSFTQAVVRGAGHISPYDQPARLFDLITRFVENQPFTN
eukprot:gene12995-15286_t